MLWRVRLSVVWVAGLWVCCVCQRNRSAHCNEQESEGLMKEPCVQLED